MLLGIDIGTSACKAVVFSEDGTIIAESTKPYSVYYPHAGWAEQDPAEWYDAVCGALRELGEHTDLSGIRGIGVDGQSWSCIPVDRDGNVLNNTPIWFDTRAQEECRELKEKIGFERIFSLCGNPVEPSYTTPKVLWFKKHCPEVYNSTYKFLQSNSYIVYRLTGQFSGDKSQGYGHFFYDMAESRYDADMAEEMGIDIGKFPDIFDCHAIVGTVTKEASTETGLPTGIPVAAGGLDAACGTLGVGVTDAGQTQEQGGQAGGMSICTDKPLSDPRLILSNHVVPGKWLLQGGSVAGGASMEWFADLFGKSFSETVSFREIDNAAAGTNPGADGMIFLPYLNGERSPIWNPNAKGVFYGMSFDKTRGHFARAVMEGVAYSLRHNLSVAEEAGAKAGTLYAIGGSTKSFVWMQIKADVTGHRIAVPESSNATALGAAILAGVGAGIYSDSASAVKKTLRIKREFVPNGANVAVYGDNFEKYLKIYERLKDLMAM